MHKLVVGKFILYRKLSGPLKDIDWARVALMQTKEKMVKEQKAADLKKRKDEQRAADLSEFYTSILVSMDVYTSFDNTIPSIGCDSSPFE